MGVRDAIDDAMILHLRSRSIAYFSLRVNSARVCSLSHLERPRLLLRPQGHSASKMTSSLAAQLAQSASLNSALLNTSRRRPTESYLFSAKEAQQHDLDAIFALGTNGFAQLKSLDPNLRHFEQALFSHSAKGTDRTLLPADANAELNRQIASFLPHIGPFLLDAPTGRVLEWLVRRFRYVVLPCSA